jgi:hypothetical protein
MSTRITQKSQQIHNALIQALATEYEKEGYYVKADHINHPHGSPPVVNVHIPDIAAYSNGMLQIVAEAETCDTLSDMQTREQWQAFSSSSYRFDIIVPKSCLSEAQRQAIIWGVTVTKWWWLNV